MKTRKSVHYKTIDEEIAKRFSYLNSYTNKEDLETYCKNYNIDVKGKNKREMKEQLMEFFKDIEQPPYH
jgi:chloramphenicol O-acetyltransferase